MVIQEKINKSVIMFGEVPEDKIEEHRKEMLKDYTGIDSDRQEFISGELQNTLYVMKLKGLTL